MTAVALQHREAILERVANGEMLHSIAKDLGVAPPNISKHLASDQEYRQAREIGAEMRLDKAYGLMMELAEQDQEAALTKLDKEGAQVLGNLARAREASWRAAAWFAEREFPHRWAQRTHTTVEIVGDLGDRLRRAQERLIEGEVVSEQHSATQQSIESAVSLPQQIIEK